MVRVEDDGGLRCQAFRHCLECHGVEVDLRSGEAPWQHGVTERMVGMRKELLTMMAERGFVRRGQRAVELRGVLSLTHGQIYQMNGFTPLQLLLGRTPSQLPADPVAHQPNFGTFRRTNPGSDTGQENRNDEHCSHRVVQGDPYQTVCTRSIGQSDQNITSGFLEPVVGIGEVSKEIVLEQVMVFVCLLELGVDPLLFLVHEKRASGGLTGKVWVASGSFSLRVSPQYLRAMTNPEFMMYRDSAGCDKTIDDYLKVVDELEKGQYDDLVGQPRTRPRRAGAGCWRKAGVR